MIEDVEVRPAGPKGQGVFARRAFEPGDFIFRRRHVQVVDEAGIATLTEEDRMHLCELAFDRFAVLAPPGCYLNHSCTPNAMRHGVKVFAYREIAAGDEITIDYRLNAFDDDGDPWTCACNSDRCTGEVACSFFALDEATQEEYLPHAPAFIRREWHRRRRS